MSLNDIRMDCSHLRLIQDIEGEPKWILRVVGEQQFM